MSTPEDPGTGRAAQRPAGASVPGQTPEPGPGADLSTGTGTGTGSTGTPDSAADSAAARRSAERQRGRGPGRGHATEPNMLPGRERRRFGLERVLVRLIATGGVIGIGVAIAAILAASKVQGWIIGLVVAIVSVALSATLWSSRQL